MSSVERRSQPRISCRYPAQMSILFPEDVRAPLSSMVMVSDVSLVGVKVLWPRRAFEILDKVPASGQPTQLYFSKSPQSPRIHCTIRWVAVKEEGSKRPAYYEVGLEFSPEDERGRESAEQFLNRAKETAALAGN